MTSTGFGRLPAIDVEQLEHSFGGEQVLGPIDTLTIEARKITALLGPSGCGKTTLLRCIGGLLNASRGSISLAGRSPDQVRRSGAIGFAFQSPTLLPWRTCLSNVLLPFELLGKNDIDEAAAQDMLHAVGLNDDSHKRPYQLSGGMEQRVSFARALITRPLYLFLDEPFGQLDPSTRNLLNEDFLSYWIKHKCTVVLVTHSLEEAVYLSHRMILLSPKPGRVLQDIPVSLPGDSADEPREFGVRARPEFNAYINRINRAYDGILTGGRK